MIKSPLRYPGGKSKAIKFLKNFIPDFSELREPFFGGGSFTFYCLNNFYNKKYSAADINYELFCFWNELKNSPGELINEIQNIYNKYSDGRLLHKVLVSRRSNDLTSLERATDFFILNRITFSGVVDSGGYSEGSFKSRFTQSSIDRLKPASQVIQKINFECEDYSEYLSQPGEKVFIFLDPPYYSSTKSRLYGKNGILHLEFDHNQFFKNVRHCRHKWLITYDDCEFIRSLYKDYSQISWKFQYGMNNYKQNSAAAGNELLIANFDLKKYLKNSDQVSLELIY